MSRDGTQPNTQFGPGQVDGVPVARTGEIQVAVCHRIGEMGDVAVDQRNERDPRRQHNGAGTVHAVLNLQQTVGTHVLPGTAHDAQSRSCPARCRLRRRAAAMRTCEHCFLPVEFVTGTDDASDEVTGPGQLAGSLTLTSILPMLAPVNSPLSPSTHDSMPSRTVSRCTSSSCSSQLRSAV